MQLPLLLGQEGQLMTPRKLALGPQQNGNFSGTVLGGGGERSFAHFKLACRKAWLQPFISSKGASNSRSFSNITFLLCAIKYVVVFYVLFIRHYSQSGPCFSQSSNVNIGICVSVFTEYDPVCELHFAVSHLFSPLSFQQW